MTVIVTKNSSTASAVPLTSDLVQGELAVNVTDKRIFTENASTAIVELGTNPSTLTTTTATVTGVLTANGTLTSSNAVITGGSVNSTPIGATTPSTIVGSTVTASTGFVGGLTGDVIGNVTGNVTGNITGDITGDVTGNVTAATGTTTLNNLVVNGTVDFTDTKLTNLATPTAATDAATKGYVDTAVSDVINAAPAALDTLNELAAALGDDANFATTVTDSIALKLPLTGGTMSGAIAMGTSKITGLGDPTGTQDAATKTYVDTADALKLDVSGGTLSGAIAMGTNKITGLGTPTDAADATTKAYTDSILGSATSAATSAAAAATSASNAATSASNAASSVTASASSASASASSAAAAASTYDDFDDRYLGDKSSDPTVDNDGNALLTGALYFNTTSDAMKVYTGSSWSAVAPTATSVTLSQVTDFPTQSGQLGKYLTTDGTTPSWVEAEAGGNSLSFVASGAISAGQTVALKSDGTVTAIASETFTETSGSPVTFQASAVAYTSTVFDEVNNKIVIFYKDTANSGYGTAVVGTVSGTSISFGTPVVFVSSAPIGIKATYLSGAGKIGIAYYVGSSIKTIIGTVSGTSISFGTQSDTGATSATVFACAYHASTSSFIVSFRNPSLSNYGQAKAAVVSGTSFSSWGSAISFNSANTQQISMIYDPFRDVSVVCYKDTGGTASLEVVLFTLIPGNPTYISKSGNWNLNFTACGLTAGMAIDSRDNKIIVMGDSYNEIKVTRFQVNADQYNITIDQATGLATGEYSYYDLSCVYDSNAEKAVLVYSNLTNPRPMKLIVATFPVGTANPSLGSVYSIDTVGASDPSAAFDSSQNKVVVVYEDQTNVNGKATVFQNASTSSNYLDFVGLSSESISDTASGTINLYGSINEAQTGLTVASNYYVQFDGTINTTESSVKIGKALTSTKLLVSGV
jgi:hypothetical protein